MRYFFAGIILFLAASFYLSSPVQTTFSIGQKSALKKIIIFTEFSCPCCDEIQTTILPKILKEEVETGKAYLTIVPTAFFEDSIPFFTAAMHLLNRTPDLFLPFLLEHKADPQPVTLSDRQLEAAIEKNRSLLESYYEDDILLPTIVVNGKIIENFAF